MTRRAAIGWAAGWVVLFALSVAAWWQYDDATPAGRLGAIAGRLAAALAIALVVRWLYVRFTARGREVLSPWLVLIACVVALAAFARVAASDDGSGSAASAADPASCAEREARTAAELTSRVPAGWRSRAAPADVLDGFRRQLGTAGEGDAVRVTGRALIRGVEGGVVVVVELGEPARLEEFVAGAENATGKRTTPVRAGDDADGGRMLTTDDGGATVLAISDPCAGVAILATSPVIARRIAGMLPL